MLINSSTSSNMTTNTAIQIPECRTLVILSYLYKICFMLQRSCVELKWLFWDIEVITLLPWHPTRLWEHSSLHEVTIIFVQGDNKRARTKLSKCLVQVICFVPCEEAGQSSKFYPSRCFSVNFHQLESSGFKWLCSTLKMHSCSRWCSNHSFPKSTWC